MNETARLSAQAGRWGRFLTAGIREGVRLRYQIPALDDPISDFRRGGRAEHFAQGIGL